MTAILITLGIAGLIWGTWLCLRGSLLLGCLVYLVLACCFGVHFLQIETGLMTVSLDRLFLLGLMVALVVQWRRGSADPKAPGRDDYLLLGLVGVITISTFTHDWRSATVDGVPIVQHLINGYFIPLALYLVARQALLTDKSTTVLCGGLACFGVYLAVIGLLETAGQWSLVFPRYIADPKVGLHFGRARGPMVHSVTYGIYLCVGMVALWLVRDRLGRFGRLLVWALLPAMLAAVYFTKTRTVWLGAGSAVLIVLVLTLRGRVRLLVPGAMVVAVLALASLGMDTIMGLKREGTASDTRQSAEMRKSFAYVSWKMFCDRPLWGVGFGHFAQEKMPYLSDRNVDLKLERIRPYVHHNTYLSVLTETGLIGLILLLGLQLSWLSSGVALLRCERAPPWVRRQGVLLLATMAVVFWQMIGHEITFTPLDHALLFTLAGVVVGLRHRYAVADTRKAFETHAGAGSWPAAPAGG